MIYAEVIGDPITQSKSPVIHRYWLDQLGIEADYLKTRVPTEELGSFIARRCADSDWRGCNVTVPHKQAVVPLLGQIDPGAQQIGAVNCIVPGIHPGAGSGTVEQSGPLVGYNTDVHGVAAALDDLKLEGAKVAAIGAGGAARALLSYLAARGAEVTVLVRNPQKAESLRALWPMLNIRPLEEADQTLAGAAAIVNASTLGMRGASAMPPALLEAVARNAAGTTLFDMVTTPVATPFLAAGLTSADRLVDGLTMLISQARRALEPFYGAPAPVPDEKLRDLLTTDSCNSA